MMFDTDQGSTAVTLTLRQDGEKLTGSFARDQGTIDVEGMITGDKVAWVMEVDAGGAFIEITMDATVGGDEMMGKAEFGGYGGADWTARSAQ